MSAILPAVTATPLPSEAGPWHRAWRRLRRRRGALVGLAVVSMFIVRSLFAHWLAPQDPIVTSWGAIRQAPSAAHWFGTDEIGRNAFARVVWGMRASLLAGVVSVAVSISLLLGVPVGLAAGFLCGWVDGVISRITDAFLACPSLILAIALAAFLGLSLTNAMNAIRVSATPLFVRLTRAQAQGSAVEDYIEAARACFSSAWASNHRRRAGAACSIPRRTSSTTRPGWPSGRASRSFCWYCCPSNLLGDGLRDGLDPLDPLDPRQR